MKYCFSFCVTILLTFLVKSQTVAPSSTVVSKPVIDSAAIANWADLLWSEPSITSDGKYFMYPIDNLPVGSKTLVIQSTENEWKKEFVGADKGFFSGDSKKVVFKKGDSLYIQALGKDKVLCIGNVASYKNPKEGAGQWLAYVTKTKELMLHNLVTDKKQQFQNVWEYQFDNGGRVLLMKQKMKRDTATSENVEWVNLSSSKQYRVWQSANDKEQASSRYSFDEQGRQLVFIVEDKRKADPANTIWYYRQGTTAIEKVSNATLGIDSGMIVSDGSPTFSKNGKYIFFKITPKPEPLPKPNTNSVQVDVWSYKDLVLQSLQLYFKNENSKIPENYIKSEFLAFVDINESTVKQLENSRERIAGNFRGEGDFVITSSYSTIGDKVWLEGQKSDYYLTSLKGNSHKYVITSNSIPGFWLSPNEKILVFFNRELKHYVSYDFKTGVIKNISGQIPTKLIDDNLDELFAFNTMPCGVAGWLKNGDLLVYDNFDIWKVDPFDVRAPENITNGYGKANNIKFVLIPEETKWSELPVFPVNKPLLLSAFETKTKKNGFYQIELNIRSGPKLLSLDPCLYYTTSRQTESANGLINFRPMKPSNASLWIVKRQTMKDAPNFYLTTNFKIFRRVSDVQPQRKMLWSNTELLSWKLNDGRSCQGVLYKPENFDPAKKYPVIVYYYEKKSANLHQFIRPVLTSTICIPWFTSRGYLVFTPDIHYTINKVSKSVVNSIIPGVYELLKLPFVDSSAIGMQGHSFGGYETNVLITESSLFAAGVEGAGQSNKFSDYGSLLPKDVNNGQSSYHLEPGGQYRMSASMWEAQQSYIENSPIFKADKVTTPLLIMHNKADESVPWGQAVEWFIALRRLDKPVWMLQYDKGAHGVNSLKDKIDYITRMTQFFDHYLKGTPAPKWMTKGISAKLKGIEKGYESDYNGSCGANCRVCNKK